MRIYSEEVSHPCFIFPVMREKGLLTANIQEADFLLLPFQYECIYGAFAACNSCYNVNAEQYDKYRQMADHYEKLSIDTGIKLVVFFYHDASISLPFNNAIIFRTSWARNKKEKNVFGMPAFIDGLPKNDAFTLLKKTPVPQVSFRGQTAPLTLPFKTWLRVTANKLLEKISIDYRFNVWYDAKLLLRRKAIQQLIYAGKKINLDLEVRLHHAAHAHPQKNDYLKSLAENAYVLCVAGWGNYSYRFYETLREGRIPVFIDTECLLPCTDVIDWTNVLVWIAEKKITSTAKYIITYHISLSLNDFEKRQQELKNLYDVYLTKEGFSNYIIDWLNNQVISINNLHQLKNQQLH